MLSQGRDAPPPWFTLVHGPHIMDSVLQGVFLPLPPVHPEPTTPTYRPRQTKVIRASALPDTVAHRPTPSSSGPGRPGSLRYATIARGGFDPKVICR